VILDVFSRYGVAWTVQYREKVQLATALIEQAASQQQITPKILTLHADRGAPQRAKPVAFLLADLGITRTHSRPYTSSDNPYSESNFKTLKDRPGFPVRLDTIEHARAHCRAFVDWYNHAHRHSGPRLMTPSAVHHGHAKRLGRKSRSAACLLIARGSRDPASRSPLLLRPGGTALSLRLMIAGPAQSGTVTRSFLHRPGEPAVGQPAVSTGACRPYHNRRRGSRALVKSPGWALASRPRTRVPIRFVPTG
jgi:Integrase core domain